MIKFTDLASFHIALMGIMVSVLTLVFAIVVGKRDELRTLESTNDTHARNRKVALENSISTLKSFCQQIIFIVIVVLMLYLGSMMFNCFLLEKIKCLVIIIDAAVTVGVLLWIVVISIIIWNRINQDKK